MRYLQIFLLLLFPILASAQLIQNDTFSAIAYWSQGDVYQYLKREARIEIEGMDTSIVKDNSYLVSLEVLEETDSNYILQYRVDSLLLSKGEENTSPTLASELLFEIDYKIETSQYGKLLQLVNWEEVKQKTEDYIDLALLAMDSLEGDRKQMVKQLLNSLLGSKEQAESQLLKDLSFLFAYYGYKYDLRDTIEYEEVLSNPLGGQPFPKYGSFYFTTYDKVNNTLSLYDNSYIDREAGRQAVMETLKSISNDIAEEEIPQETLEQLKFTIDDYVDLVYDLSDCSIMYGSFVRVNTAKDLTKEKQRIDLTEYSRIQ